MAGVSTARPNLRQEVLLTVLLEDQLPPLRCRWTLHSEGQHCGARTGMPVFNPQQSIPSRRNMPDGVLAGWKLLGPCVEIERDFQPDFAGCLCVGRHRGKRQKEADPLLKFLKLAVSS